MLEHKYFESMLPRAVIAYSWFQPRSDGMAMACHVMSEKGTARTVPSAGRLMECFVLYTG